MRSLLILLFGSLFLGASYPEVTPTTIFYRSFYSEMKALEKPERLMAAPVQTKNNAASATSVSITMTSTGVNNLVVIAAVCQRPQTITSVTDNQSNSYTVGSSVWDGTSSYDLYQIYGLQTTGGVTSITINVSSSCIVIGVADEFSGNATSSVYDTRQTGTGTGTSMSVSTLTPAAAGQLIVVAGWTNAGRTYTAGSGYTNYGNYNNQVRTMYRLSSSTSETAPWTLNSSTAWSEIATSFNVVPAPDAAPALSAAGNVAKTKYKYKNNE